MYINIYYAPKMDYYKQHEKKYTVLALLKYPQDYSLILKRLLSCLEFIYKD